MRKVVSLFLILCLLLSTGILVQANVNTVGNEYKLTVEEIDQLSEYIYQRPDGEVFFNKEKAVEAIGSVYSENDMIEMENMTQTLNEEIKKGKVYIDHQEGTENNGQLGLSNEDESLNESTPIIFTVSPVKEIQNMLFCLSKSEAHRLRNELKKTGLSTVAKFLISAGIKTLGLFKLFKTFATISEEVFPLVTMKGRTADLEQALDNAAWLMDANNYVVFDTRVESVWNSFGNWVQKKPPNTMNYIKYLKYRITTYRIPTPRLVDYL